MADSYIWWYKIESIQKTKKIVVKALFFCVPLLKSFVKECEVSRVHYANAFEVMHMFQWYFIMKQVSFREISCMPVHLCRKKNMFWSDNGQVNQRTKEYQHMGIYFFKVMKISDPPTLSLIFISIHWKNHSPCDARQCDRRVTDVSDNSIFISMLGGAHDS